MAKTPLLIAWFLLIFGPVIRSPLGPAGDISLLACTGYLLWSLGSGRRLHKSVVPFCLVAFFLTALATGSSIFVSSTIDGNSFQAMMRPVKGLLVFLGLFFAISRMSARNLESNGPRRTYEMLLGVVYACVVVHGVIIVLQSMFPPLLDLTYRFIGVEDVIDINRWFRMPGLSGAGGAQVSAVQGLGFLIGVHLALLRGKYLLFTLGNLLLVLSFVLTGRTGFVLVGVAIFYCFVFILIGRQNKLKKRNPLQVVAGVVGLSATAVLLIWLTGQLESAYEQEAWVRHAVDRTFQTYLTYVDTGDLSDSTLGALGDMYDVPGTILQWTFGDARLYNNTLNAYTSDIGYVRLWWGYGILGLLGYIGFYLMMGYLLLRPRVRQVMGSQNVAFGLIVLASIFVLNYKETFFFARMSYQISVVAIMGLYWLTLGAEIPVRFASPNEGFPSNSKQTRVVGRAINDQAL